MPPEEGEVASVNRLEVEQGSANDERKEKEAIFAIPKKLLNEIGVLRDSLCNNMSEFDSDTSSVVSIEFEKWI